MICLTLPLHMKVFLSCFLRIRPYILIYDIFKRQPADISFLVELSPFGFASLIFIRFALGFLSFRFLFTCVFALLFCNKKCSLISFSLGSRLLSRILFHTLKNQSWNQSVFFRYEKKNYDSLTAAGWHILFRELSPFSFASLIFISFAIRKCINFSLQPYISTTHLICQHFFKKNFDFFQFLSFPHILKSPQSLIFQRVWAFLIFAKKSKKAIMILLIYPFPSKNI